MGGRIVSGLKPNSVPANVVITLLRIAGIFADLLAILKDNTLKFSKASNGCMVWGGSQRLLFGGGLGASNFIDSRRVLCHCRNVEEVVLVETGGCL